MRQPDAVARGLDASGGSRPKPGPAGWLAAPSDPLHSPPSAQPDDDGRLPPGQHVQASMPIMHYGPVPAFNASTWNLRVSGATEEGRPRCLDWEAFSALPHREIVADFHCVTKFTILGVTWAGVAVADLLAAIPPAGRATHVMVWADYGYGANLPLEAFGAPDTLLATHREGRELKPEQGHPVRLVVPSRYGWKSVKWVREIEYLLEDRRGFWEERGYHNNADPWQEQRYSYQEQPGQGPGL